MKKWGVLVLVGCSFIFSGLVFAQTSVDVFKTYLAEKKTARSLDEVTNIEKKYRTKDYVEEPGVLVSFVNASEWQKSQLNPDQVEIAGTQEDGDMATIEYKMKDDDYSYGEATLVKEDGAWKIKEYGLIDFDSDLN